MLILKQNNMPITGNQATESPSLFPSRKDLHRQHHFMWQYLLSKWGFVPLLSLAVVVVWETIYWGADLDTHIYGVLLAAWLGSVIATLAGRQSRFLGLYLLVFGFFLLPREFIRIVTNRPDEPLIAPASLTAYQLLLLALAGLLSGFFLYVWLVRTVRQRLHCTRLVSNSMFDVLQAVRSSFKPHPVLKPCLHWTFYTVLLLSIISRLIAAIFVFEHGYTALYSEYTALRAQNLILYLLWKVELGLPVLFACELALHSRSKTFPRSAIVGYVFYLAVNLGTGQRFATVAGSLVIGFYVLRKWGFLIRRYVNEHRWLTIIFCVVIVALVTAALSLMESLRRTGTTDYSNLIVDFFYTQGVTFSTIKRGIIFNELMPEGHLYSLSAFNYGFFAIIQGLPTYQGNSVETALLGSSFSHALTFVADPTIYLSGVAYGSSFIAEAFHDFGFTGVFMWAILIGFICTWMGTREQTFIGGVVRYAIFTSLLWTVRGEASGFVEDLVQPSNGVMLMIFLSLLVLNYWFGLFSLAKRPRKISLSTRRRQGEHVSS